jgi:hypothetical protein
MFQDAMSTSTATERAQGKIDCATAQQTQHGAQCRARLEALDRYGTGGGRGGRRSLRELVLDTLDEIGVPVPPRVISDFAGATHAWALRPQRFASLQRAEERSYQKAPGSHRAWIVPTISTLGLTAISRIVAQSTWELERRIIGARTPRTNHLRTLLALLDALERARGRPDTHPPELATMLLRYAESVPGALEFGKPLDPTRVRRAAEAELARIEPADLEERRAAAARLSELPARYQLWGRPALIEMVGQMRRSSV